MTIPYMMNCSHDGDGWCIACVKKLGEECEGHREEIRRLKDRESSAAELLTSGIAKMDALEAEVAELRAEVCRLKAKSACPECNGQKIRWYSLEGRGTGEHP